MPQTRTRLERDDGVRVHPQGYRPTEHELTTSVQVRAAALWVGPGSHGSGHAAAWWWDLTDDPPGRSKSPSEGPFTGDPDQGSRW